MVTRSSEIATYTNAFTALIDLAVYGAAARRLLTDAITALDSGDAS
ncbi:hypothetical protein [Streptosporangium sp. KLBMP 9127]|nr:hypothetical protein [Streptosporangium sp. KLBMP 9127]